MSTNNNNNSVGKAIICLPLSPNTYMSLHSTPSDSLSTVPSTITSTENKTKQHKNQKINGTTNKNNNKSIIIHNLPHCPSPMTDAGGNLLEEMYYKFFVTHLKLHLGIQTLYYPRRDIQYIHLVDFFNNNSYQSSHTIVKAILTPLFDHIVSQTCILLQKIFVMSSVPTTQFITKI